MEVGAQAAWPSQLTGEHRGVRASGRHPPPSSWALAFNSGKRKTKQNKAKGRTGLRTGERENASQQSQPTPQQDPGTPGPAFRPCRAGRMYRGLVGSRTVPHKDHGGAGQAGPLAPLGQLGLGGRGQPQAA